MPPPVESPRDESSIEYLQALTASQPDIALQKAWQVGNDAVIAVAAAWMAIDPMAVEQWAGTLGEPLSDRIRATLSIEATRFDIAASLRLAGQIQDAKEREETVGFAVAQWAASDPQAAFDWLQNYGESDSRTTLERRILPALADHDPEAVANWIASGAVTPGARDAVVVETVQRWVQQDAVGAASWVAQFPPSLLRQTAVGAMMRVWAVRDRRGAEAWIRTLPFSSFRQEAAAVFASSTQPDR